MIYVKDRGRKGGWGEIGVGNVSLALDNGWP